jgi:hypothetical protein
MTPSRRDAPRIEHKVAAGSLTCLLDGDQLRDLRIADVLAAERIYPSVRGAHWLPSETHVKDVQIASGPGGFTAHVAAVHHVGSSRMRSVIELIGRDAELRMTVTFTALTDVAAARLGICVILPSRLAGRRLRAEDNGTSPAGLRFSRQIQPWPLSRAARQVWVSPARSMGPP